MDCSILATRPNASAVVEIIGKSPIRFVASKLRPLAKDKILSGVQKTLNPAFSRQSTGQLKTLTLRGAKNRLFHNTSGTRQILLCASTDNFVSRAPY